MALDKKEVVNETEKVVKDYLNLKSPLLLILEEIQQKFNFVPKEAMITISNELRVPLSRVYSVVTFYNSLKTEERGKHLIRACLGTACSVKKNYDNLKLLKSLLGIEPGSTTSDKLFTLETVNCFGACSMAPVIEVDGKLMARMTPDKIRALIQEIKNKENNK